METITTIVLLVVSIIGIYIFWSVIYYGLTTTECCRKTKILKSMAMFLASIAIIGLFRLAFASITKLL